MSVITATVLGGGWVTSHGHGMRGDGRLVEPTTEPPRLPRGREIFDTPPPRLGRFDTYTRAGCTAVALALRDAGLDQSEAKRPIGLVSASRWECHGADLAYQRTTLEAGGAMASPNLFSYTLPGIALGESAVHFGLTGPTLCVGDSVESPSDSTHTGALGLPALEAAMRSLCDGAAPVMLAGWIECPPDPLPAPAPSAPPLQGAVFVALEGRDPAAGSEGLSMDLHGDGALEFGGRRLSSILDMFGGEVEGR